MPFHFCIGEVVAFFSFLGALPLGLHWVRCTWARWRGKKR